MRTETTMQGERRAARMHWWRQVVDRTPAANWDEDFDEMVALRFRIAESASGSGLEAGHTVLG